jgi:signal transduction histidine kinase
MHSSACDSGHLLKDLVHDLRQPLGTLETSAYYLSLHLENGDPHVREQIAIIQHQVERAAALLNEAVAEWSRLQTECLEESAAPQISTPPAL